MDSLVKTILNAVRVATHDYGNDTPDFLIGEAIEHAIATHPKAVTETTEIIQRHADGKDRG